VNREPGSAVSFVIRELEDYFLEMMNRGILPALNKALTLDLLRSGLEAEIRVFDNCGRTFDQYTVVIGQSVYTMSQRPNHPQGFNQYLGELSNLSSPESWMTELGDEVVQLLDLPKAVLVAIIRRLQ